MNNIRGIKAEDWSEIAKIYKQGIDSKIATFQDYVPTYEVWNSKYIDGLKVVFEEEGKILGFAALGKVSERNVYSGVLVLTIYIDENSKGKGIGTKLIHYLSRLSDEFGYWVIQSEIIAMNEASINLHKKCGFRLIGIKEKIGKMDNGVWHDLVLMEKRSKINGMT